MTLLKGWVILMEIESIFREKFMNSNLNSKKFSNRIKIEEWPSKYSPLAGKDLLLVIRSN